MWGNKGEEIMNEEIMISILCLAYNHEEYIEKTIKGFLNQKCSYSYEIIIHDDASTDNTAKIIKKYEQKYSDRIKGIYQIENQYSQGISINKILFEKSRGKYIAVCEGDDYWNNSEKLERQIKFLEEHLEYSACVHSGYYAYEDGVIKREMFRAYKSNCDVPINEILEKWMFPTASIVYRKSCRPEFDLGYGKNLPCGDYPLIVYLASKGKIFYFDIPMCVYRTMSKSSISKQISCDIEKKKKLDEQFIKLLNAIDRSQNYIYHEAIYKHIVSREFARLISEYNWKKLHEDRYKELYACLNWIKKIQIWLVYYFPTLGRVLDRNIICIRNKISYWLDKKYTDKNNFEC